MRVGWWIAGGAGAVAAVVALTSLPASCRRPAAAAKPPTSATNYVGSGTCRDCHARFYTLWETSHHGKAMQPFTPLFARTYLTPCTNDVRIGGKVFRAEYNDTGGRVIETDGVTTRSYPILHAMGGKNVFYFLTQLDRGRLQVLPVAYHARERRWYDTTASMVRHFPDGRRDAPLDWTDRMLTFNAACHDCHVSQLDKNYDPASDSYRTTWREPGINCETCHGPCAEHVRVCREAPTNAPPRDLKIISTKSMTPLQRDYTCAPCHAKMSPLTGAFTPGARFFDHYDLVGLEDPDFHPDGRDLGENYTYTSWLRSPCVRAGKLECVHCHTSSGRFRFADNPNAACLPCHAERVANAVAHTHHETNSVASRCIACHMPLTVFGQMQRSDHSLLPPTPAATLAFHSPNACNICHQDKECDARWADAKVREWHKDDYQAPALRLGAAIAAARSNDWQRLPGILALLAEPATDEVVAVSLIRLLGACDDARLWPVLRQQLRSPSPYVRGAAAAGLGRDPDPATTSLLAAAARDDYRLVRIRAAEALLARPRAGLSAADQAAFAAADREARAALTVWPDRWQSHYNLGLYHERLAAPDAALAAYRKAMDLRPDAVPPLVNAAGLEARMSRPTEALALLRRAHDLEPDSAPVCFNLALAEAEQGDTARAETLLRAALKADPRMAQAAFNLGVLLCQQQRADGLEWCRYAAERDPSQPRYGYTYAFFLHQRGVVDKAVAALQRGIAASPGYGDNWLLLGQIHEEQGRRDEALRLYREAAGNAALPADARRAAQASAQRLAAP